MNAESLPAILIATGTLLTVLGAGVKWLIARVEKQVEIASAKEADARAELKEHFKSQIESLRENITELKSQLREAAKRESIYMHRVMTLENYINRQPGMHVPETPGWPL